MSGVFDEIKAGVFSVVCLNDFNFDSDVNLSREAKKFAYRQTRRRRVNIRAEYKGLFYSRMREFMKRRRRHYKLVKKFGENYEKVFFEGEKNDAHYGY